jgi:hypothetical protein
MALLHALICKNFPGGAFPRTPLVWLRRFAACLRNVHACSRVSSAHPPPENPGYALVNWYVYYLQIYRLIVRVFILFFLLLVYYLVF